MEVKPMARISRALLLAVIGAATFAVLPAAAHEVEHEITRGEAIVVRLRHEDRAPFSNESYEVFRPGEATPYQVGRTDPLGRLSFVPDAPGDWRVRAFSEDGHGADLVVPSDASLVPPSTAPTAGRTARIVLGLAIILGLFGAFAVYRSRRNA
jgi:nickel transport protein